MSTDLQHEDQGRLFTRRSLLRMTCAAAGGLVLSGGPARPAFAHGTLIPANEIWSQTRIHE